jgi:hypothetical protein
MGSAQWPDQALLLAELKPLLILSKSSSNKCNVRRNLKSLPQSMSATTEIDEADPLLPNEDATHPPASDPLGSATWLTHCYFIAKKATITSKTYPLLIFAPLTLCSGFLDWPSSFTTLFSILAIIPLSALVSYSSDLLSQLTGDLIGGLINATFGNSVELSVCAFLIFVNLLLLNILRSVFLLYIMANYISLKRQ